MTTKKPARRVTLVDIAKKMGVSPATISLALRDNSAVAAKTRKRVWETVEKLGYVYNRSAAQLRTQRSYTIGLIVPNIVNTFFAELADMVEETLDDAGCRMFLARTSERADRQAATIKAMLEYRVDGVVICPVIGTTRRHLLPLTEAGVPLVVCTRPVRQMRVDYVGADNARGAALAAEYLISRGHRRIAFIGGPVRSVTRQERLLGFQQVIEKHHLDRDKCLCVASDSTIQQAYQSIIQLLKCPSPPTAALCYNDIVAFGVILGLWAAKVTPGRGFAVVGFDNLSHAALWSPPLTTVSNPPGEVGMKAAKLLLERIAKPRARPRKVILDPSLVVRKSCGE